jgi:hypothetical protein
MEEFLMSYLNAHAAQAPVSFPKLIASTVVSLSLLAAAPASWSQENTVTVKRSGSGICHDATSRHYERVKSFKSYTSMQACLDDGGRKPKK